jgi:EpsI family protein
MSVDHMPRAKVWKVPLLIWVAGAVMIGAALLAAKVTPHHVLAEDRPELKLESVVPGRFGEWVVDPAMAMMLVDPTVQKKLDSLYTQTLNRTYVNARGERVMLSIAYGRNQNTESTAAHRPEFCYSAQGFVVSKVGLFELSLNKHQINVVRLDATSGDRREPITYWVTLGDSASVPGFQRKLHQLKYGLQGLIVDGMLVRVSTIRSLSDTATLQQDFALHERFLREMELAIPGGTRSRIFGS